MSEIIAEQFVPNQLKKIERDENGLIKGVNYTFDSQGFVNWRRLIPKDCIVANRQLFEKNGKKVPEDLSLLHDKELLILLQGIKILASIRGFSKVIYNVVSPTPDYVVTSCEITWIGNFETEGREVTFSALGDASPNNTTSFTKLYLAPMSENRSFVRSVRSFLKIPILGADEIMTPPPCGLSNPNLKMGTSALLQVMKDHEVDFNIIQKRLIDEKFTDEQGKTADKYTSVADIPLDKTFELISRIKKKGKQNE